ncbi:hypothetical protein HZS_4099 [Henneguya salminicola]|nr:hypothetical protein HZS_4099 [Henneguya salminicola]
MKCGDHYSLLVKLSDPVSDISFVTTDDVEELTFSFNPQPNLTSKFTYSYKKSKDSESIILSSISITLNVKNVSGISIPYGEYKFNSVIFDVSLPKLYSFVCSTKQFYEGNVYPGATITDKPSCKGTFLLRNIQFIPSLRDCRDKRIHCDADFIMNVVVPLSVGAVLAGLIIIVLIVFVIIRFKTRRQIEGYEQIIEE